MLGFPVITLAQSPTSQINLNGKTPSNLLLISNKIAGVAMNDSTGAYELFSLNTNNGNYSTLVSITNGLPFILTNSGSSIYCLTVGDYQVDPVNPSYIKIYGSKSGTLLAINADGSNYKILHSFDGNSNNGICEDGALVISNKAIYGLAQNSLLDKGTLFTVNTDGSNYRQLTNFTGGSEGFFYDSYLRLIGPYLYVSLGAGDSSQVNSSFFKIQTNGSNFQNIYTSTNKTSFYSDCQINGITFATISYWVGNASSGYIAAPSKIFSINSTGSAVTPIAANINGTLSVSNALISVNSSNSIVSIQTNGFNEKTLTIFSANNNIELLSTIGMKIYFTLESSTTNYASQEAINKNQLFLCSINQDGSALNVISAITGSVSKFYLDANSQTAFGYFYNSDSTNAVLFFLPLPK